MSNKRMGIRPPYLFTAAALLACALAAGCTSTSERTTDTLLLIESGRAIELWDAYRARAEADPSFAAHVESFGDVYARAVDVQTDYATGTGDTPRLGIKQRQALLRDMVDDRQRVSAMLATEEGA